MGHFSSDYETAAADLVDYYSQPILYSDPSLSSALSIDAAVYGEKAERRKNEYGWYLVMTRNVLVLNADLTARSDGTFTIDGKDYAIESMGDNGDRTLFGLTRAAAAEVSRPGYRGTR